MRQILRNLLTNASRYGGQHIEIGLDHANGNALLVVADDGPGIPQEDRERIFRPIERAHESPGVPASVGLGLTVSRQLSEAKGGKLEYEFDGRSILRVTLPAMS